MPRGRRLARSPRSAAALITIRARVLQQLARHRAWRTAETRLAELLQACFAAHPPFLREIDQNTPPAILSQIVRYEAVHAVRGLADLRRRLARDRRCYALFSDALPGEPLVFIEVALTQEICRDVSRLLDTNSPVLDPADCRCAMFYSISSCHDGLRGVPFGNTLIRMALDRLQAEMPQLHTFATVSPVPGFRAWVTDLAQRRGGTLLNAVNALDHDGWSQEPGPSSVLEDTLLPLCATYLLGAKRGDEPLDPVARFHLANGAKLDRINWLGDRTDAGFARSAGIVANYIYDVRAVEANRDVYQARRAVIAGPSVQALASYSSF